MSALRPCAFSCSNSRDPVRDHAASLRKKQNAREVLLFRVHTSATSPRLPGPILFCGSALGRHPAPRTRQCAAKNVQLQAPSLTAYVGIRQHTSAYVGIRQHTSAYVGLCQHTSAYVGIRRHTSAYDSIRKRMPCMYAQGQERACRGVEFSLG